MVGDLLASSVTVLITLPITIHKRLIFIQKRLTVADLGVADLLLLKVVLHNDLVDIFNGFGGQVIGANIDLDHVGVTLKRVFEGGSVGLTNLVARDINVLN